MAKKNYSLQHLHFTMKTVFHAANERGHANHGWLVANHSFSFAGFYDAEKVHFGALRVLNDDHIAPAMGFGEHPHDNMEIVTIPLNGALRHKDSMGNEGVIEAGDVQIMSAGSGVRHSEANNSTKDAVDLFQIWVFPKITNINPRYDQKTFDEKDRDNKWQTLVSPLEGEALWINQDAWFSIGNYNTDKTASYKIHLPHNGVYIMVIEGKISIGDKILNKRDAMGVWDTENVNISILENSKLLVVEVPMN